MGRAFSVTWRKWGSWRGMDRYGPATRRKCLFNELTEKGLEYLGFLASAQSIRAWRRTRPLTSVPLIWLIR